MRCRGCFRWLEPCNGIQRYVQLMSFGNQLTLLRNDDREAGATDFYSYRYLASEGFLPGYSFPRLPLAAYIPARRGARS